MQHSFLKGTVTVLLLLLVTSLAGGADNGIPLSPAGVPIGPSVPNLINFQGRLTDASGNPVADGSHTVNFTLWTLPTGGVTVWTENTSQTTSGGLFTHNLGSIILLNPDFLQFYDSLYLQIVADGQTITPRIRLTSTSYSHVSGGLEVRGYDPTILGVSTFGHGLQTFGDDTQEQIRLWGEAWGEIFLFDTDASNDLTAILTSSGDQFGTGGGALWLQDDAGFTTISLEGGTTGDASAVFPSSAINAGEMFNEPGVSNSIASLFVTLASGNINYVVDSVDITIPSSGYVEVTAGCYLNLWHESGSATAIQAAIDKTRANVDFTFPGAQRGKVPSGIATDIWSFPCTSTRLYSEAAGTHRYYFNVKYESGTSTSTNIAQGYIRAIYYPTLYGTVTIVETEEQSGTSQFSQIPPDGSLSVSGPKLKSITVEEHNARVQAEVAKVKAELEARLLKLEERLDQQSAGVE